MIRRRPYTVSVETNEQGEIVRAVLNNNKLVATLDISFTEIPLFIHERSALLRLTDISKTAKGEVIGRRLDPNKFTIYIDYDEFNEIKKKKVNRC